MKNFNLSTARRLIACGLLCFTIETAYTQSSAGLMNFSTQEPQQIIMEMFRLHQRVLIGENLELPLVTVMLWPDGTQISGFVTDLKSEKQEQHFAMQIAGDVAAGNNIFYGYLSAVRGVVVHNIDNYEHLFTEVTSKTKMNKPPKTTKLDVKKRMDTESKNLSAAIGTSTIYELIDETSADAITFFIACNLITDVTICLKQLAGNEIGKKAIAEEVKKVKFIKSNKEIAVSRKGNDLIIEADFTRSFTTSQNRWKLQDMLEGVL